MSITTDMNGKDLVLALLADRIDRMFLSWHENRALFVIILLGLTLVGLYTTKLRKHMREAAEYHAERDRKTSLTKVAPFVFESASKTKSEALRRRSPPRVASGKKQGTAKTIKRQEPGTQIKIQPLIFFSSLTGTTDRLTKTFTSGLESEFAENGNVLTPQIHDLSYIDLDDYFISGPKKPLSSDVRFLYCILIPSYDIDTIITNFVGHLDEVHNDFRIDTAPLAGLAGYSVFGIGDRDEWPDEQHGFCKQAIEVDRWMAKLTGHKRAYPLGTGNVKSDINATLADWAKGLSNALRDLCQTGTLGEGVPGSGEAVESDDDAEEEEFPQSSRRKRQKRNAISDVEDVLGGTLKAKFAPLAVDFTTSSSVPNDTNAALKPMVPTNSPTYTALTKQGYTIVGSHSGVKICRWTKSALRGRGSCYKNSFYGIKSHLCMETTPSLSCSNKCVFCWRHGTNPVSTTWRWEVDPPEMIFDGAKQGHYKKIKMMRGVPGVRAERFEEAMRIRHCALSLVGEPIFYPHINKFVSLLHSELISSFLVCNAQHPQQLQDLQRVTQLYVSIDASNKDSLRKIDRPLHRDFWERFQSCLYILREKRFLQRTVFRLTLVKGFNIDDEIEGYADLVEKGLPCFVEIKGVTYCGTSSAAGAGLTMQNVPFYEEVQEFAEALNGALERRGLDYGIAAEHAHSCCILLASKRFLRNGTWCTIIDYDRFFKLLESGEDFGPEDYCSETPEWALWGNGGFDPADERVDRKGRPKEPKKVETGNVAPQLGLAAPSEATMNITEQRQQEPPIEELKAPIEVSMDIVGSPAANLAAPKHVSLDV